jgi:hypothetical protein
MCTHVAALVHAPGLNVSTAVGAEGGLSQGCCCVCVQRCKCPKVARVLECLLLLSSQVNRNVVKAYEPSFAIM